MGVLGWIMAVVLVALMLPLLAMMYLDNLKLNKQTEENLRKIERIERQIERKKRDKEPSSFDDNPVFDRMRRFVPLSMPRPQQLGKT
jgi:hypothetical protein